MPWHVPEHGLLSIKERRAEQQTVSLEGHRAQGTDMAEGPGSGLQMRLDPFLGVVKSCGI